MAKQFFLGLSLAIVALLIGNAESRVPSESEIYTGPNQMLDGLNFLASLAAKPPAPPAQGRRRSGGGGGGTDLMSLFARQATTSLTAQICQPACARISTNVDNRIVRAMLPCNSVCEIIDVALQSLVGLTVHFAAGPPPAVPVQPN